MFFIGLDLGQKRDFSALAVVEREEQWPQFRVPGQLTLRVRHLERMPLGTRYTNVAARVGAVVRDPALAGRSRLVVDATGVGAPVVDLLRAGRLPCALTAVTITSGEKAEGWGQEWRVPKKDLIAGVRVLLESGQLKIQRALKEAETLVRELGDIRAQVRPGGRTRLGADGTGQHDDLALAVALACWQARRMQSAEGTRRLPGI